VAKRERGSSFGKVDGKNPHAAHDKRSHGVEATQSRLSSLSAAQIAQKNATMNPYAATPKAKAPKKGGAPDGRTSAGAIKEIQSQAGAAGGGPAW
jgi:hypothetical protein